MNLVARIVSGVTLGALLLLVVAVGARPLSNPDTWFHLRIGHELFGPWSLSEPGSLTRFATADWVSTQWSLQMLAASFEQGLGLAGVAWLFGVLNLVFVATIYLVCRRLSSSLPAVIVAFLVVFAASASLSARPQIVSLVLVGVTVGAWLRSVRDLRPPYWLVPLTWVWATAHGFWSIGVLVGLVAWLGLVLDRRTDRRDGLRLLAVPALSLLAACLTPVGPALLGTQLAVSERSAFIGEWGATSFHEMPAVIAAVMIGLTVVLWARQGRVPWTSLLMLLLAAALVAYAVRLVAVGAVVTAPLLAAALHAATGAAHERPSRREAASVWGGVIVTAVLLATFVPRTADQPANVPDGFSSELSDLPAGSAVMVDGPVGSWIEWAFPHLQPTMDGMFDAYTIDYMKAYRSAVDLEPGWERFVERSGATVAVLTNDGPLAEAMVSTLNWRETAQDGRWVLLQAP